MAEERELNKKNNVSVVEEIFMELPEEKPQSVSPAKKVATGFLTQPKVIEKPQSFRDDAVNFNSSDYVVRTDKINQINSNNSEAEKVAAVENNGNSQNSGGLVRENFVINTDGIFDRLKKDNDNFTVNLEGSDLGKKSEGETEFIVDFEEINAGKDEEIQSIEVTAESSRAPENEQQDLEGGKDTADNEAPTAQSASTEAFDSKEKEEPDATEETEPEVIKETEPEATEEFPPEEAEKEAKEEGTEAKADVKSDNGGQNGENNVHEIKDGYELVDDDAMELDGGSEEPTEAVAAGKKSKKKKAGEKSKEKKTGNNSGEKTEKTSATTENRPVKKKVKKEKEEKTEIDGKGEKTEAAEKTGKKIKPVDIFVYAAAVVLLIVLITVANLFFNMYVLRTMYVDGVSMEPAYVQDEKIYVSALPYIFGDLEYGDVVIIDRNVNTERDFSVVLKEAAENNAVLYTLFFQNSEEEENFWLKRVIGLPGDTISFTETGILRNGEYLVEDYLTEEMKNSPYNLGEFTVGEGEVFVMGDNRSHSTDSRNQVVGNIKIDHIVGKVVN